MKVVPSGRPLIKVPNRHVEQMRRMLHPPRPINGPIKLESTVIWPSYLLDFLLPDEFEADLLLKVLEDILVRVGMFLKDVEYEISLVDVIGIRT